MNKESYNIETDNFEGNEVCYKCPKRKGVGPCSVYSPSGMIFRSKVGHCPIMNRWADWREDKPIVKQDKKRIGQQKQK